MKIVKALGIFFVALLFVQCKTVDLRFKVFTDPLITLPEHIKQVTVVNRTILDSTKKDKNLIESIITGEAFLGDKEGAEDCIYSFKNYFNNYGPIPAVIPEKHRLSGNIGSFKSDQLDWKLVKKICRETKSSALMSLEKFDTNSDAVVGAINNTSAVINSAMNGGSGVKDIRYHVMYGWILYDTLSMQLIYYDEQTVHEIARGVPMLAPLPKEAVKNTARFIGEREARKFNPSFYWVRRQYYKKGKSADFSVGYRRAAVNNWNGAIEMWTKCLESNNRKTAGRACYNIAIAHEVKGNLKEAFKWAQKSYADYGTKLAKDYSYVLQRRINNGN